MVYLINKKFNSARHSVKKRKTYAAVTQCNARTHVGEVIKTAGKTQAQLTSPARSRQWRTSLHFRPFHTSRRKISNIGRVSGITNSNSRLASRLASIQRTWISHVTLQLATSTAKMQRENANPRPLTANVTR